MLITYADNHTWRKTMHPDIFPDFGTSNSKKVKACLASLEANKITHEFTPLDEDFFQWFQEMYDTQIGTRKNFGGQKIVESTLHRTESKHPYFSLTLKQDGKEVGGAIFTQRKDRISLVYRAFLAKFPEHNLRATPALYAEYLLHVEALRLGLPDFAHGADKNPYGINSAIGLATFKLSVGCTARLQRQRDPHQIETESIDQDALILELPEQGEIITDAHLITTVDNLPKYEQLLKYPDQLNITTHLRSL